MGAILVRILGLIVMLGIAAAASGAPAAGGAVVKMEIRGAIGPATSDYIVKGIEHANASGASLVVIEIDTPGGLDSAMRDIIKAILGSAVPVVSWVSPPGSRAASAGTYILYASHVAAMAPATNLGAATPVQIGGGTPVPPDGGDTGKGDEGDGEPGKSLPGTAMERKSINDAVAYIRGLAELRGRNADWAERAVREAVSLNAQQAVKQHVVDVLAGSLDELLTAIDGRTVRVQNEDQVLSTEALDVEEYQPDWRTRLLAIITDPNVAYMLMLAGIYGLLFEGYNPGAILPGVVGAICLLLALYAFQVLPVNYAGLALILLGVALLVAEAFVPSFGALGLGGIAALVFGSIILIDSEAPGFAISRPLIGGVATIGSALLFGTMYFVVRSRRQPVVSGAEQMLGAPARALEDFDSEGMVLVHGERWHAHASQPVCRGQRLKVTRVDGLELEVEPDTASS